MCLTEARAYADASARQNVEHTHVTTAANQNVAVRVGVASKSTALLLGQLTISHSFHIQ
jgi:hypothetical protein